MTSPLPLPLRLPFFRCLQAKGLQLLLAELQLCELVADVKDDALRKLFACLPAADECKMMGFSLDVTDVMAAFLMHPHDDVRVVLCMLMCVCECC